MDGSIVTELRTARRGKLRSVTLGSCGPVMPRSAKTETVPTGLLDVHPAVEQGPPQWPMAGCQSVVLWREALFRICAEACWAPMVNS